MNRLIRAEMYRAGKTYHMALWTVMFCALFTFIGFMDMGLDSKAKAVQEFPLFMESAMMMFLYLPLFVGGLFVASYENKTLCYEMMTGNRTINILLSKIIAVVPLLTLVIAVCLLLPVLYLGCRNGIGKDDQFAAKFFLLLFFVVRASCVSIFIMAAFRSLAGLFVIFVRYIVLEGIGMLLLDFLELPEKVYSYVCLFFTETGVTMLTQMEVPTKYFVIVLCCGAIEMLLWFVVSYVSYEKRWFV